MKLFIVSFDLILSIFIFSSVFTFFLYFIVTDFNVLFNILNQFSDTLSINSKIQSILFLTKNQNLPYVFAETLFEPYNAEFIPFNLISVNQILTNSSFNSSLNPSNNIYQHYTVRTIDISNKIFLLVIKNETK